MPAEPVLERTKPIHLRGLDIGASENTIAQEYRVHIPHPFDEQSVIRPESVNLQVLTWENPKPERPFDVDKRANVQIVALGGFVINAVELGSEITELLKYSNKIVGISHPDAPQSKINPRNSPLNDIESFHNSGIAVYRAIESLAEKGILDRTKPITLLGFSTGAAVAAETAALDMEKPKEKRLITNFIAMVAPAGLHGYDSQEEMRQLAMASGPLHMASFLEDLARRRDMENILAKGKAASLDDFDASKHPEYYLNRVKNMKPTEKVLFLLESMLRTLKNPITDPGAWLQHEQEAGHRLFHNLGAMFKHPEYLTDPAWRKVVIQHILFEMGEYVFRSYPSEELTNLLQHFHVMWKDQGPQGEPHLTPPTAAVSRSEYNLAHLAGLSACAKIHDTNVFVLLGMGDPVVNPKRLLSTDELAHMQSISDADNQQEYLYEKIFSRVREIFPNNKNNVQTNIMLGVDSHHLGFRRHAAETAITILRRCYPQKQPEIRTVYYGSGNQAKKS